MTTKSTNEADSGGLLPQRDGELYEAIMSILGTPINFKGLADDWYIKHSEDTEQILALFAQDKATLEADKYLADGTRFIGTVDVPGALQDPQSGRKIYNEAHVAALETGILGVLPKRIGAGGDYYHNGYDAAVGQIEARIKQYFKEQGNGRRD